MADESMEHAAPDESTAGSADDHHQRRPEYGAEEQRQFEEAIRVLIEQGRHGLVQRVFLTLDQRQLDEAMRVFNEEDDDDEQEHDERYVWTAWADEPTFRGRLASTARLMLLAGYDEHETFRCFHQMVLMAARQTAGFRDYDDVPDYSSYSNGGFGAVPAECSICFEGFVDGVEVSVMPCPSRGHEFHTGCIAKWLGVSNMCPLCRHVLGNNSAPAASMMMVAEPDHQDVQQVSATAPPQDGPPRVVERRSTRRRRLNVRTSGPEWARA